MGILRDLVNNYNRYYFKITIMKKFVFAALCALALAGCSQDPKAIIGKWSIEKAMGRSTAHAESPAFINFNDEGNINGCASVNNYFGSYHISSDSLSFYNVGMTRAMGSSMDVDQAVSEALHSAATYEVDDEQVYVFNAKSDTVFVLKKMAEQTEQ